jgi:hypothetical protein
MARQFALLLSSGVCHYTDVSFLWLFNNSVSIDTMWHCDRAILFILIHLRWFRQNP